MKKIAFLISLIFVLSSCEVEVIQDYGVDSLVFPENRQDIITLKGTILADSLVTSIAVHRSGVSPTYPTKNIEIVINTDSVNSVIINANTAIEPTTEQLWFKGTVLLPASCYALQSQIVMPANSRTASIPIMFIKSEIDKLDKGKVWITALSIKENSNITVYKSNNINFLKIIFR